MEEENIVLEEVKKDDEKKCVNKEGAFVLICLLILLFLDLFFCFKLCQSIKKDNFDPKSLICDYRKEEIISYIDNVKRPEKDSFKDFLARSGYVYKDAYYEENIFKNNLGKKRISKRIYSARYESSDEVNLKVLMFHSINMGKADKSLSASVFEDDIKALKDAGYNIVSCDEVIAFVKGEGDLKENPVIITFDDGYLNNYALAYPILKKYNANAVIFAIGTSIGKDTYPNGIKITPHFDLDTIYALKEEGLVDVEYHTYSMHQVKGKDVEPIRRGVLKLKGESKEEYILALENDIQKYIDEAFRPYIMSYPYGCYSDEAEEVFSSYGIIMSFTTEEKVNVIKKGDMSSLRLLGRYSCDELGPIDLISLINQEN